MITQQQEPLVFHLLRNLEQQAHVQIRAWLKTKVKQRRYRRGVTWVMAGTWEA